VKSETRGPSRRRFQAAIRTGRKISYLGVFDTREERDRRVERAREDRGAGRDLGALSEWEGSSDGRTENDDPWLIPTRHPTGEQRLCAAMLLQAARDLASDDAQLRSGARVWVLSEAKSFGTFRFCADSIGRDIAETRRRMLRLGDAEKSNRVEGGEWQREPQPLRLLRKDSAEN